MEYIEKTSRTIEEAINLGLSELKCSKNDVDIEILEKGCKGFLGIGTKQAKVRIKLKFNPEKIAIEFLEKIIKFMNLDVKVTTSLKNNNLKIDIYGKNVGILIGKRAQMLDSLQNLLILMINKGKYHYINVYLDSKNYRKRRKESLIKLATNLSKKVKNTGKKISLEPMVSYERKIIHSALQNEPCISTYSKGREPYRYIVIELKNK